MSEARKQLKDLEKTILSLKEDIKSIRKGHKEIKEIVAELRKTGFPVSDNEFLIAYLGAKFLKVHARGFEKRLYRHLLKLGVIKIEKLLEDALVPPVEGKTKRRTSE